VPWKGAQYSGRSQRVNSGVTWRLFANT
jgi:hypothetical protein